MRSINSRQIVQQYNSVHTTLWLHKTIHVVKLLYVMDKVDMRESLKAQVARLGVQGRGGRDVQVHAQGT